MPKNKRIISLGGSDIVDLTVLYKLIFKCATDLAQPTLKTAISCCDSSGSKLGN